MFLNCSSLQTETCWPTCTSLYKWTSLLSRYDTQLSWGTDNIHTYVALFHLSSMSCWEMVTTKWHKHFQSHRPLLVMHAVCFPQSWYLEKRVCKSSCSYMVETQPLPTTFHHAQWELSPLSAPCRFLTSTYLLFISPNLPAILNLTQIGFANEMNPMLVQE